MLCQSCFHHQRTFFREKCYKTGGQKQVRKYVALFLIFVFDKLDLLKRSSEKLSAGAYLTLEKIESHFPWNFPLATPRDEATYKAYHQIAGGNKIIKIQHHKLKLIKRASSSIRRVLKEWFSIRRLCIWHENIPNILKLSGTTMNICTYMQSHLHQPSHVLNMMNCENEASLSYIRVSSLLPMWILFIQMYK